MGLAAGRTGAGTRASPCRARRQGKGPSTQEAERKVTYGPVAQQRGPKETGWKLGAHPCLPQPLHRAPPDGCGCARDTEKRLFSWLFFLPSPCLALFLGSFLGS